MKKLRDGAPSSTGTWKRCARPVPSPCRYRCCFRRGELLQLAQTLDGVVLSGSPADVDPARFGAAREPECADPDPDRERTDFALLEHSFAEHKPVLAICFGIQSLNVFLGGTLVQDIPSRPSHDDRARMASRAGCAGAVSRRATRAGIAARATGRMRTKLS